MTETERELIEFVRENIDDIIDALDWIEETVELAVCPNPNAYDNIADLNCIITDIKEGK